jgi:para-nitrobenzyl esterase
VKRKTIWAVTLLGAIALAGTAFALIRNTQRPPDLDRQPDYATARTTKYGIVVGTHDGPSLAWLGVPYAKAERWRAPQPPDPWTGTRLATQAGPLCPQFQRSGVGGTEMGVPEDKWGTLIGSEDCLTLNIRTPSLSAQQIASGNARLPVMMFVPGGGNTIGHGELYNYSRFVGSKRVVVVTINHRLGPLGWFSHAALNGPDTSPLDRSGNYGVLDMIGALSWIRENIAAFGGDPDNVTVFGLSTGGSNITALMVSPLARGLFHKAIIESGVLWHETVTQAQAYRDAPEPGQRHSARELVNQLLLADYRAPDRASAIAVQNAMSDAELAAYLRGKSTEELMAPLKPGNASGMYDTPNLILDGHVLPDRPFIEQFRSGEYNAVPMIVGSNRDEAKFYMVLDPRLQRRHLGIFLRANDPERYQRIAQYRSESWRATTVNEFVKVISAAQSQPVYVYRFDWDELANNIFADLGSMLGAAHSMETAFISGQFERFLGIKFLFEGAPDPQTRDLLSDQMMSYWAAFAYSGAPGRGRDGKLPDWDAWQAGKADGEFMVFDSAAGGGLRMSNDSPDNSTIKARLASDTTLSQKERCHLYVAMYYTVPINAPWSRREFDELGPEGCRGLQPEDIYWEEHAFNVGSAPGGDQFN